MHDQLPALIKLLLGHERVITNLGKLVARRLSGHLNETSMLSILRPLWPGITRRSLTRRQRHQGKDEKERCCKPQSFHDAYLLRLCETTNGQHFTPMDGNGL
jgi:hypothetical protein